MNIKHNLLMAIALITINGSMAANVYSSPTMTATIQKTASADIGDLYYWTGRKWLKVMGAKENATLTFCQGKPTWGPCPFKLGRSGPAGGIVFFLDATGLHGMEAAPVDQASAPWGCDGTSISGASGTAIGTGAANTAAIVAGCSEPNTAAKIVDEYSLNGHDDWYLPSRDELSQMYNTIGPGAPSPLTNAGGFNYPTAFYWSSTEENSSFGYMLFFSDGLYSIYKTASLKVRAVRSF